MDVKRKALSLEFQAHQEEDSLAGSPSLFLQLKRGLRNAKLFRSYLLIVSCAGLTNYISSLKNNILTVRA